MADCQITIDPATRRHLERVGLGDVSAGIRILADLDRCKPGHQRWHYVIMMRQPTTGLSVRVARPGYSRLQQAEHAMARLGPMDGRCYLAIKKRADHG
jgi:hypothetical protein